MRPNMIGKEATFGADDRSFTSFTPSPTVLTKGKKWTVHPARARGWPGIRNIWHGGGPTKPTWDSIVATWRFGT